MTTQSQKSAVPMWVLAYTGFLIVLGFGAGMLALVSPQNIFLNVTIDFSQITAITSMFAARNVALGSIAAYALFKRDAKFLLMVFAARFVVEVLDLIITLATGLVGGSPVIIIVVWVIVFLLPEFLGILALNRIIRKSA